MQQSLYRKWRPQTFDSLKGQTVIRDTLVYALKNNKLSQAYLFCGPRGTGKTTTARLIAKYVNCTADGDKPCNTCVACTSITDGSNFDILEVDAASNRGIDEIRQLRDSVRFAPTQAKYKVYIIDEVHMLTREAFNALLKTLEEPPAHALFILATTESHKIPATIISRCQRYDFRLPDKNTLTEHLMYIAKEEKANLAPDAAALIARLAEGSFRDALSLLEQILSLDKKAFTLSDVEAFFGYVPQEHVEQTLAAILRGDLPAAHAAVDTALAQGADLRAFCDRLLQVSQDALESLLMTNETVSAALFATIKQAGLKKLVRWIDLLIDAMQQSKQSPIARLPLDVAIVKANEEALAAPQIVMAPAPVAPPITVTTTVAVAEKQTAPEPLVMTVTASEPVANQPEEMPVVETVSVPVAVALPSAIDPAEWQRVLDALKVETPSLVTSLSYARVMGIESDVVKIAVKYKMHADKLNQVKNRAVIEAVTHQILQAPLKIDAYVDKDLVIDDDEEGDDDDLSSVFEFEEA
jgi:DNA polymerase-3 subunit gamma/tau